MDWMLDERTNCWSVQTNINIRDHVELVDAAHTSRGALSGQRDVLTTTTAKRIRERMVADLVMGAVLPPVVLGISLDHELLRNCGFRVLQVFTRSLALSLWPTCRSLTECSARGL